MGSLMIGKEVDFSDRYIHSEVFGVTIKCFLSENHQVNVSFFDEHYMIRRVEKDKDGYWYNAEKWSEFYPTKGEKEYHKARLKKLEKIAFQN